MTRKIETWFDVERPVIQPLRSLDEEPTRCAVPGPLPFRGVDENHANVEHRNPPDLKSQFAHMDIPTDNSHERGPVIPDGHVITAEPSLAPPINPRSSQPLTKVNYKNAIAFIRVALQVAVAGLKAAPIPDLDRIPGALLLLIETYEVSYAYPAWRPLRQP